MTIWQSFSRLIALAFIALCIAALIALNHETRLW